MDMLKPNMYVRTTNGIIKVAKIENDVIKDEKGDVVQEFDSENTGKYSVFIEEPKDYVWQCLWNNDIKSIVTKEQFESMSYKVGD